MARLALLIVWTAFLCSATAEEIDVASTSDDSCTEYRASSGTDMPSEQYKKAHGVLHKGVPKLYVPLKERTRDSVFDIDMMARLMEAKYKSQWRGEPLQKDAVSLELYIMLMQHLSPGTVFDIGMFGGGSALWFSGQLKALGLEDASVVTMDIQDIRSNSSKAKMDALGNILFVQGDLHDGANMLRQAMEKGAKMPHPWLITEDCHANSKMILDAFLGAGMQPGDYIVWEDTHPFQLGDWRYFNEDWVFNVSMYKEVMPDRQLDTWAEGKLNMVEDTMNEMGDTFAVDAGIQDMFGYNGASMINSVFRMMKPIRLDSHGTAEM